MISPSSALVLIGPMGAGKTSIGRRVAKALGRRFLDTDAEVVRAHGPVDRVFAEQGEEAFRRYERIAVSEALAAGGVVSLGGGAVLDPDTRADLASCRVVLLTVEPAVVAARIRGTARPLLQAGDAVGRWTTIFEARRGLYEQLADLTIDTSRGPIQHVVERIVAWSRADAAVPAKEERP